MLIRYSLRSLLLALCLACSSARNPVQPAPVAVEKVPSQSRTLFVQAEALNLRASPAADARIVARLKRGTPVVVLASVDGWTEVRSASLRGWVATRFLATSADSGAIRPSRSAAGRPGCPADRSYAFSKPPRLLFSREGAHGLVVIEADVNAAGIVTATRVVSNATGRSDLAGAAQRELSESRFDPPIRSCKPTAFIYTYKRVF
ncbi:MAG TPA: SH3 domain-containing protein [Thermoanaerobaculia bacterium]|nr:SH3 domain-containing protein [Thermoanaerobaculia bacterium]